MFLCLWCAYISVYCTSKTSRNTYPWIRCWHLNAEWYKSAEASWLICRIRYIFQFFFCNDKMLNFASIIRSYRNRKLWCSQILFFVCDKNLVKKWVEFYLLKTELFFEPGERFENLNCKVLLINTCLSTSLKLKCINYLQVINTLLIVNTRQNRYTYTYIYPTFACVNNSVNTYPLHWTQITVIKFSSILCKTCHYNRLFIYLSIGMPGLHRETSHLTGERGGFRAIRVFIDLFEVAFSFQIK